MLVGLLPKNFLIRRAPIYTGEKEAGSFYLMSLQQSKLGRIIYPIFCLEWYREFLNTYIINTHKILNFDYLAVQKQPCQEVYFLVSGNT